MQKTMKPKRELLLICRAQVNPRDEYDVDTRPSQHGRIYNDMLYIIIQKEYIKVLPL